MESSKFDDRSSKEVPSSKFEARQELKSAPVQRLREACYLTGPTAAGKTAIGVELALRIGAEIISLDSMALYRGMDIGTAKPTAAERAAVPHHLIDILEPADEFSVAQYLEAAERAAVDIAARGKQLLFVGGTALYLKALLRGLFSGPPADWTLRRELEEVARIDGTAALHRRLQEVDPAAAAKLPPADVRRIIRAIEVHRATGQPISSLQQQFATGRAASECRVFVLDWPREPLERRIRDRVDAMFAAGLVEEVRRVQGSGFRVQDARAKVQPFSPRRVAGGSTPQRVESADSADETTPHPGPLPQGAREEVFSRTAGQAVGYREVIEHLRGERNLAATIELVKLRTRQFAKRQLTWFRSLSECRWVEVAEPLDAGSVARRIVGL